MIVTAHPDVASLARVIDYQVICPALSSESICPSLHIRLH